MTDPMQGDEEIESFVVRNTGYYRDKWSELHESKRLILTQAIVTKAFLVCN